MTLINTLNRDYFNVSVVNSVYANMIAKERASYLKRYLKGEIYSSREAAKKVINVQINNAQAILEACEGMCNNEL